MESGECARYEDRNIAEVGHEKFEVVDVEKCL
jgi:hypothetical protein